MKKTYKNPTLTVVKIQTAHLMQASGPKMKGETSATSGNFGRRSRFSDDDFDFDEE